MAGLACINDAARETCCGCILLYFVDLLRFAFELRTAAPDMSPPTSCHIYVLASYRV